MGKAKSRTLPSADLTVSNVLDYGRRYVNPYSGDWKAWWLLGDIHDPIWPLRTKESRLVEGQWRGTLKLNWGYKLPDGSILTDDAHAPMRQLCQKMAFIVRESPKFNMGSSLTHVRWFFCQKLITQWLYLQSDVMDPDGSFFARVDNQAINHFMDLYAEDGAASVLAVQERTIRWLYDAVLKSILPPNYTQPGFLLPKADKQRVIEWLRENDGYTQSTINRHRHKIFHVNRTLLADRLAIDQDALSYSDRYIAFLRQFEPTLEKVSKAVLVPAWGVRATEYPTHTTPLIKDARVSRTAPRAKRQALYAWETILRMRPEFPVQVPDSNTINLASIARDRLHDLPEPHTPWIPLKTALKYTKEALRWVSIYQDPLIAFYIQSVGTFNESKWFNNRDNQIRSNNTLSKYRDEWIARHVPPELRPLNIGQWTSWFIKSAPNPYCNQRECPSLNDAMQVLVGAVIVLLGMLKPIRESEVLSLPRHCIKFVKGDGYWIEHELRKAGIFTKAPTIERPIPWIAAKGISGLITLGDYVAAATKSKDIYATESLLFLPEFLKAATFTGRLTSPATMSLFLNRFCDYVDIPTDEYGRRWYVRIQEMRKSFLITLFWCFRFASLDAARWMAGHAGIEELYAYIQANFPGDELPTLYAEYAALQLWQFSRGDRGETENVEELYRNVCAHFGVREINLIPADELTEWLALAFEKGLYDIEPYTVQVAGATSVAIAFRITGRSVSA